MVGPAPIPRDVTPSESALRRDSRAVHVSSYLLLLLVHCSCIKGAYPCLVDLWLKGMARTAYGSVAWRAAPLGNFPSAARVKLAATRRPTTPTHSRAGERRGHAAMSSAVVVHEQRARIIVHRSHVNFGRGAPRGNAPSLSLVVAPSPLRLPLCDAHVDGDVQMRHLRLGLGVNRREDVLPLRARQSSKEPLGMLVCRPIFRRLLEGDRNVRLRHAHPVGRALGDPRRITHGYHPAARP